MPGLLGTYNTSTPTKETVFDCALQQLVYTPEHVVTKKYNGAVLKAAQIPFSNHLVSESVDDIKVWFDGEVYPIRGMEDIESQLIKSYKKGSLSNFLSSLNGYFCAAIFDGAKNNVLLISDRYGVKPIYFYQDSSHIAWSSEMKAILALDNIDSTYNKKSISDYLSFGMVGGDKTWYKNINLLPASSIVTIDLNSLHVTQKNYWTWNKLEYNQKIDFKDAVVQTGDLLHKAINSRIKEGELTTLALSGGLDSRVLLAMSNDPSSIHSFTFGCSDAQDYILAQEVAQCMHSKHTGFESTELNWLHGKLKSIWSTEGYMPFVHLHSSPFCTSFPQLGQSVLNGFGGATLLGGLFLKSRIEKKLLSRRQSIVIPDSAFFSPHCPESKIINQHMRRFINQGSIDMGKYLYQRKPYIDTDLLDFVLTLPLDYRRRYKLFSEVIHKNLPTKLKELPWENTGIPFSNKKKTELALRFKWPAIKRRFGTDKPIFSYDTWINSPKGKQLNEKYCRTETLIGEIIGEEGIYNNYNPKDDNQLFGRYLSLELWLRITNNLISIDEDLTSL